MAIELKQMSRSELTTETNSFEAINAGSLQRIAAAVELTAKNYSKLISDNESLEWRNEYLRGEIRRLEHSNAALKGHLNRMKKEKQNESTETRQ